LSILKITQKKRSRPNPSERLQFSIHLIINSQFLIFNFQLSILHTYAADRNAAGVAIDTPTVFLNAVDTVGVGADVVDVKRHY
jgi:hypothetical protein